MSTKSPPQCRIVVTVTDTDIQVTFSDWLKVNPKKLDRIRDMMGKAWRRERAKVVHEDRVAKSKAEREAHSLEVID